LSIVRVPLTLEPIEGVDRVDDYDRYASRFMWPEYLFTTHQLERHKVHSGSVLDIGTGSGRLALQLNRSKMNQFRMIGLDASLGMLKKAQANAGINAGIEFMQANASQLPFPDETFDVVISYASLHHWKDPIAVFNEMWRVTKDQAWIIVRDNRRMWGNPFFRTLIWLMSRFMSKRQRVMWPASIMASYTTREIEAILAKTQMLNYRVKVDMLGFDLCVETKKTAK
jgi:ubiquinone/menaquinone biosynthesis C-methylase UbiE